jgi:hypothetical protein
MAVSAAEYYEVRWRVKGNDEAWSAPRRVSPVSEVVIEELDRNTQYEFEVRAVSNCGAKSIWVPNDYTVPGAVPPTSVYTLTAQPLADGVHLGWTSIATPAAGIESSIERSANGTTGWAERARVRSTAYTDPETSGSTYYYRVRYVNFAGQFGTYSPIVSSNGVNVGSIGTNASNALADAAAAQADADAANAALADIASDGILSPVEKPVVIRDYNVIVAEQAGIDAQATAYAITTPKTAYDTAVSALTSYLGTLTAPVLWSDLTGNTTIVGATFRSKFADVYTTRQAVLNAIYAAAKAKADAAQDTANTAVGQVTQLPVINGGFDIAPTGYGWNADPSSGWTIDTAGNTPGVGPNSAKHTTGATTSVFRNAGLSACQPGQVYKAQALIKAVGANGVCYVGISWCTATGSEITTTPGNLVTGSTTAGSYAVGSAPAGTVYARTILVTVGQTTGTYYVDNVLCSQYPSSLDEVPDGATKYGAVFDPTTQTGIARPGQNLIPNSTGALGFTGLPGLGWVGGSQQQMTTRSELFGAAGPMFACAFPGTGAVDQGFSMIISQAASSVPVTLSADMDAWVVASGSVFIELRFLNASGTEINSGNRPRITATNGATPMRRYSTTATTEAGTVSISVVMRFTGTMGSNSAVAWRNIKLEVGSVATPYNDAASQFGNNLIVSGSGQRLGDMRNQVMVGVGNYGAGWSGGSISYSATTTSATITAAAATLQLGSSSLAYNSANVTVSGSAGLVRTYYLYYDDDGYTGGSKTLNATTSQVTSLSANGRILVGQVTVTFPTSGTGGGGGSTGCPVRTARVVRRALGGEEEVSAGAVVVGDRLKIIDPITGATRWGRVSMSKPAYVDCVRVVQRGGVTLSCSVTAPLGCPDGFATLAPESLGRPVTGLDAGAIVRAEIVHVASIGKCWVQHITCEDDFFLAGDQPGRYLAHHNLKPSGP